MNEDKKFCWVCDHYRIKGCELNLYGWPIIGNACSEYQASEQEEQESDR